MNIRVRSGSTEIEIDLENDLTTVRALEVLKEMVEHVATLQGDPS